MCDNIRQKAYPVVEKSGILFAYLGPGEPPPFPHFDCFVAPSTHTFAFKGFIDCNWLQSLEVGIDPAHTSFLHRFFNDDDPKHATAGCSATSRPIPTCRSRGSCASIRVPQIDVEPTDYGMRILTYAAAQRRHTHIRVTNLVFPHAFLIPLPAR